MNSEQVKFIKDIVTKYDAEKQQTKAFGYVISFDDNTLYDSNKSFIAFNEDKQLVVCIRTNFDHYRQAAAPFEIGTTPYDKITHIDSYYERTDLIDAVKALTGGISEFQETALKKWMDNIQVQNKAPNEERPYFKTDPKIQGGFIKPTVRKDLNEGDVVHDQGGFDNV